MSHFAATLGELMEHRKLSQADLARRAGIVQPQISRLLNAEHVRPGSISDEDFERLCKVFNKPNEQATLMRAKLLDVMAGPKVPGIKLLDITVAGEALHEAATPYNTKLTPKMDKDVQTIIEHLPNDRLIRDMVSSIASHLRRKP